MGEVVYIDRDGKKSKRPPRNIPPLTSKPLYNGEGCSAQNGIPCRPILNGRVRKRAKKKKT